MNRLALALFICLGASAEPAPWTLARTAHFELYSQAPEQQSRSTLLWLEQLRAFFVQQAGVDIDRAAPVRIISFGSSAEYKQFSRSSSADAYFIGSDTRSYLVLVASSPNTRRTLAHEYAHVILRAAGLQHPAWLNEGLSEFFSTLAFSGNATTLGNDVAPSSQLLSRQSWMPISQFLAATGDSPFPNDRTAAELFYAQSWLFAEMLVLSPSYGSHFHDLMTALTLGTPGEQAFAKLLGKSPVDLMRDLHQWAADRGRFTPVRLPAVESADVAVAAATVSTLESQAMLADLALAEKDLDLAESQYRALAAAQPGTAEFPAALGIVAFRRGDREGARRHWKRAIDLGIHDASLCFNYAVLADQAGLSADERRPALERAIELKPDYDDARFSLALLEKNAGRYAEAARQYQAMRKIAPARAFGYWTGFADALNELGRREEAQVAARKALPFAVTAQDRRQVDQLVYFAQTDLSVGFATDANGRQHMVTTRIPHGAAGYNPFIEPSDDLRRVEGSLREIDCGHGATRLIVEVSGKRLTLTIADPGHVQMRNAPSEFTCGAQPATTVAVEYAAAKAPGTTDGIVRGLEFR